MKSCFEFLGSTDAQGQQARLCEQPEAGPGELRAWRTFLTQGATTQYTKVDKLHHRKEQGRGTNT